MRSLDSRSENDQYLHGCMKIWATQRYEREFKTWKARCRSW